MPVEKNDVDISTLFNWRKEFILEGKDEVQEKLYMRLVGDAELNRARVFALRKSTDLRKKLKDLNSDERVVYVQDPTQMTRDDIIATVLALSIREISQKSYKEVDIPYPKEPSSEATLELQEKYQSEVDQYNNKKQEAVKNFINKEMNSIKESLEALGDEELAKKYEKYVIDELCEQEMLNNFRDICCYFGTYRDENYTERYFNSTEDFQNLPSAIKADFVNAYIDLEISAEELKKLRGVTQ